LAGCRLAGWAASRVAVPLDWGQRSSSADEIATRLGRQQGAAAPTGSRPSPCGAATCVPWDWRCAGRWASIADAGDWAEPAGGTLKGGHHTTERSGVVRDVNWKLELRAYDPWPNCCCHARGGPRADSTSRHRSLTVAARHEPGPGRRGETARERVMTMRPKRNHRQGPPRASRGRATTQPRR